MLGNFSKMFGGGLGGLIGGALIPNLVLPALQTGDIVTNCSTALASAAGNWTGTLTSMVVTGLLGSVVTYLMPKNQANPKSPNIMNPGNRLK